MFFISARNEVDNQLHTAIVKQLIDDWIVITAIGYSGGGQFDEFCGAFKWDNETYDYIGYFSRLYHDPDFWENYFSNGITTEGEYPISDSIKEAINTNSKFLWSRLIQFDCDTNNRVIRDEQLVKLKLDLSTQSSDWDADIVDWVSNKIWGLNFRFDW